MDVCFPFGLLEGQRQWYGDVPPGHNVMLSIFVNKYTRKLKIKGPLQPINVSIDRPRPPRAAASAPACTRACMYVCTRYIE